MRGKIAGTIQFLNNLFYFVAFFFVRFAV